MQRHLEYPDVPFHALLARAAEAWPNHTAILFKDRRISYRELNGAANRLAHGLIALGLGPGDRVALFTPNCPEYEIAFFGCTRAGLVPSPLNPAYKEREVQYQAVEAGARAMVVHPSLLPVVDAVRPSLPALEHVLVIDPAPAGTASLSDLMRAGAETQPMSKIRAEDLAALPFSSGTTGTSKGVRLTQRNLVANALQFAACTATTERDVLLIFLPLYHIYGVALMADSIVQGATQILMERFDLAEILRLVEDEGVTQLYVVPPVMLALASSPEVRPERLKSLRFLMCAAAPMAPEVGRRVVDRLGLRVIQAYGMTEASPLTHMHPLDDPDFDLKSVGITAPDTECRIVDVEDGEMELAEGEVGEVIVAGPQVMAGYWNAPEETARAIRGKWLYTGDIGYMDGEGRLYIVDRKKEMIKYKAFSIAPAELEGLLLEHPAVADCAVTAQPDADAGEVPHAFVVSRPDRPVTAEELQDFVASRVATYKQIRSLEFVDAIPRTPSGKVLRRVLKERAQTRV
jgi:acyl-CoA synthetase (AMP-forming)/AMP-acid ligase II